MELLDILGKLNIPVVTGIGGYFVGRPKQEAEVEATNVENAGKVIDKWAAYAERLEKNIEQLGIVIEDLNDALQLANNERLACEKTLAKLKIKYHDLMQLYNELLLELQELKGKSNIKNVQDSIVRQ